MVHASKAMINGLYSYYQKNELTLRYRPTLGPTFVLVGPNLLKRTLLEIKKLFGSEAKMILRYHHGEKVDGLQRLSSTDRDLLVDYNPVIHESSYVSGYPRWIIVTLHGSPNLVFSIFIRHFNVMLAPT